MSTTRDPSRRARAAHRRLAPWAALAACLALGAPAAADAPTAPGLAPQLPLPLPLRSPELADFQPGRVEGYARREGVAYLDAGTFMAPRDLRVLDPNGALRSVDYLQRGMRVYFRYRARQEGLPVLTEVRVTDAGTDYPES